MPEKVNAYTCDQATAAAGGRMKESELREAALCAACGKKFGATGLPLFWRVQIRRFGVMLDAVERQDGLAAFLGSPKIANVMGPDEDLAIEVMDPVTVTICDSCSTKSQMIAQLAERGGAY